MLGDTIFNSEAVHKMWLDMLNSGTPGEIICFLWRWLFNDTQRAFYICLSTLMLRLLLVAFYFSLLYAGIATIKKGMAKRMGVRANYYCWYALLFSVVLAYLPFNNSFMAFPSMLLPDQYMPYASFAPYVFFAVFLMSAIWLTVVIFKLAALARMNHKIRASMKRMERYDDNKGLAGHAALALSLRKAPDIRIAGYIETPVSYGVFQKTVLLPANYEEKYTETELYLLLLHEMTHIKHGDTVKLYLLKLIGCFLWAAPVMSRFVKSFKRDSELLCDNRVVGLMSGERDTYGNLILKECAYKTARFGFGFSDSYHAIENRLDALYRYKADGRLKLLAIIPAALLLVCAVSFAYRVNWLAVNDNYTSDLQIAVLDGNSGEYILLPPEECAGLYKIVNLGDGFGDFIEYNDDALRAHLGQYAADGIIQLKHVSDNYIVQTGESELTVGMDGDYSLPVALPEGDELMVMFGNLSMSHRTFAEYVFLKIASWL